MTAPSPRHGVAGARSHCEHERKHPPRTTVLAEPHAYCKPAIARPLAKKRLLAMEVNAVKQACLGHVMDVTHGMCARHRMSFHADMVLCAGGQRPRGVRATRFGRHGNCGGMVQPRRPTADPCTTGADPITEQHSAACIVRAPGKQAPGAHKCIFVNCTCHERLMRIVTEAVHMPPHMQAAQESRRVAPSCRRGANGGKERSMLHCCVAAEGK